MHQHGMMEIIIIIIIFFRKLNKQIWSNILKG